MHSRRPGAVLAVDTSGEQASVALLLEGGRRLVTACSAPGERAGDALHVVMKRVLDEAGAAPNEIERFAAVRGPGSFTGLRVGLAAVQGLALAAGRPALGIETTQAVARAWAGRGRVLVVLDGGQGRLFVGEHEVGEAGVVALDGPLDLSPDETLARLARRGGAAALLRGEPACAAALRQAGCVTSDAPLASACAALAAGADPASSPAIALYAREPAIRPQKPHA